MRRLGKNSPVCSSTAAKLLDETFTFTAQDKKKALRLKSHVRVISSHEPVRAPQSARDTKSSYESAKTQSPGQSSLDSHGTAVVESSLLTDNFKELLHDPVEVQLQKLLGANAEDFLNPTFREGAKKTLNPMATQRKRTYFKNLFRVGTRARGVHAQKKERAFLTLFLSEVSERTAGNDHVTFLTFLFSSRACLFNSLH